MTWTSPIVWTNGTLTAAQLNQQVSANMAETAAAKATTSGSIFVGTGLNSLAERIPSETIEFASETTSSTTYVNLATVGPNVTVTTGDKALVGVTSDINNSTAGATSVTSWAVYTPPNVLQIAPDDNYSLWCKTEASPTGAAPLRASSFRLCSGLIPQSNLFQQKYRVSAGTGTYNERALLVIPL